MAGKYPEKLAEIQAIFDGEARKYSVYPLDSSFAARDDVSLRPSLTLGKSIFTYDPGAVRVSEGTAPDTKNKSFGISADVEIPAGGANGVLVTQGGNFGGWGLFVNDGKPEFAYAFSNQPQHKYRVAATELLPPGKHTVRVELKYDGGGRGKGGVGVLMMDGNQVAEGRIERTIPNRYSLDETFDVGEDTGTSVVSDYASRMPFRFTGNLQKLTIELQ